MIRRVVSTGLACAALYAAVLGTGATAQETPTPTGTPASSSTPFASPVETVLTATPTATQTETPAHTSTPDSTPTQTSTPERTSTPTQTSTPERTSTPTQTATPEAQQGERSATPTSTPGDDRDAASVDLVAEACEDGKLTKKERRRLEREGSISAGASYSEVCGEAAADGKKAKKKSKKKAKRKKAKKDTIEALTEKARTIESPKPTRTASGLPTLDNPTYTKVDPGAAKIGVPNFFIEKFKIPPFLLPIYEAAGMEYGVRWEVLAAINEVETDYGRNLNISSAGALGWMQFMPATWEAYGVDANDDGVADPFNPVDAIFSAARYLRAAGAEEDLRKAIFAYNHADWYVDMVLLRARVIGGLPANFTGALTGLTQARFPVWAKATYAGEVETRKSKLKRKGNPANVLEGSATRRGIRIFARRGAPVIAVNDGKVIRVGESERLGKFVQLQDSFGNTFTYARLASIPETVPYPKDRKISRKQLEREMALPKKDAKPKAPASATKIAASKRPVKIAKMVKPKPAKATASAPRRAQERLPAAKPVKERLFANPARPQSRKAGGEDQIEQLVAPAKGGEDFQPIAGGPLKVTSKDFTAKPLKKGTRVLAGTILGRIGKTVEGQASHVLFEIRPAGRGARRIDPLPVLNGWKLLESTALYRAQGKNALFGEDAKPPTIGQILLMGKETLVKRVLANPRIDIYNCGRSDVRTGAIDRRVLATLEYLAASGLRPTVTSLKCGHGYYTKSGNVSHHSSGNAVDIAAINGIPMLGNQGKGSITDLAVQRLLTLQGTMKPSQIITLMTYEGADNTYAMADHHDHIHVGWQPQYGTNSKAAKQVNAALKPSQWIKLIDRLNAIDNPTVDTEPSKYALKVKRGKRASDAHAGE